MIRLLNRCDRFLKDLLKFKLIITQQNCTYNSKASKIPACYILSKQIKNAQNALFSALRTLSFIPNDQYFPSLFLKFLLLPMYFSSQTFSGQHTNFFHSTLPQYHPPLTAFSAYPGIQNDWLR